MLLKYPIRVHCLRSSSKDPANTTSNRCSTALLVLLARLPEGQARESANRAPRQIRGKAAHYQMLEFMSRLSLLYLFLRPAESGSW